MYINRVFQYFLVYLNKVYLNTLTAWLQSLPSLRKQTLPNTVVAREVRSGNLLPVKLKKQACSYA